MSLKLKPFLTAALLVAAGVGPARASKRPPKGVWPLFPLHDSDGRIGASVKVYLGTGVEASIPLKCLDKFLKGKLSHHFLSKLSFAQGDGIPGTIYDQMQLGYETHAGFILGTSFDMQNDVRFTGWEFGSIGGGVYRTGTLVIPIWDPAWVDLFRNLLNYINCE